MGKNKDNNQQPPTPSASAQSLSKLTEGTPYAGELQNRMVRWQLEWPFVIVKAWKDGGFRKLLLAKPRAALASMGIDLPRNITLHVKAPEHPNAGWQKEGDPGQGPHWELPNTEITLWLPPTPDEEQQALAIVAYSRFGHENPLPIGCS